MTWTNIRINICIKNCANFRIYSNIRLTSECSNMFIQTNLTRKNIRIYSYKKIWYEPMYEYIFVTKIFEYIRHTLLCSLSCFFSPNLAGPQNTRIWICTLEIQMFDHQLSCFTQSINAIDVTRVTRESIGPLVHWSIGPLVHWSNVKCQISNVKCQMSNVICHMSYVKCQMSIRLNFCRSVPPELLLASHSHKYKWSKHRHRRNVTSHHSFSLL